MSFFQPKLSIIKTQTPNGSKMSSNETQAVCYSIQVDKEVDLTPEVKRHKEQSRGCVLPLMSISRREDFNDVHDADHHKELENNHE